MGMEVNLLDVEQAAEILGIHPATLYRWARVGRVPSVRFGPRVVRFKPDALAAFVDENATARRDPQ